MAPWVLLIQSIAAGYNATSAYFGAERQKKSLLFDADMSDFNADQAEKNAERSMQVGQREVGSMTLKAGQVKGSQRVALAANGVETNAGSAAELQASTDIVKEIDKATIEDNALRSAWGYKMQATNFRNRALVNRASAAGIDPTQAAIGSILGSAASASPYWLKSSPPKEY